MFEITEEAALDPLPSRAGSPYGSLLRWGKRRWRLVCAGPAVRHCPLNTPQLHTLYHTLYHTPHPLSAALPSASSWACHGSSSCS